MAGPYAPATRPDRPPRCCSRCRTPYMCAWQGCPCHAEPVEERGPFWTWNQVVADLTVPERIAYLADPREFQTRWFVRHLIRSTS